MSKGYQIPRNSCWSAGAANRAAFRARILLTCLCMPAMRILDLGNSTVVQDLVRLYESILNHSCHPNYGPPADPALVSRVKNFLETTEEAQFPGLVGLKMSGIHVGGDPDAIAAEQLRRKYAKVLIERARTLEPGNLQWQRMPGTDR
jgi:hypothetical protein